MDTVGPSAAALEIAALDKRDFERALESILRADAEALEVDRVSYWAFQDDRTAIQCVLGYVRHLRAYERGARVSTERFPRYVEAITTEEVLSADDASADPRTSELARDYLEPLGITSMLDVPMWVAGVLVGILCHEHVGPARRWRPSERGFALTAAQGIATCLEARECRRAEEASRRADFLARATGILTETLEIESIPGRLVELAVPELADWCVLDVARGGAWLERVAVAHVDPARRRALADWARRWPRRPVGECPSSRAFSTGQSLFIPELDESVLAQTWVESEHCDHLRWLGARSLMAVPLSARGRRLGAIVFGSAERRYTQDDLRLAEALAARAAIALDNARLHREANEAIARRDEFLAMAAHELYTPLTSLSLAAAHLAQDMPETGQRSVDVVQRGARRLTRLVDEMLDVARASSGSLTLRRERADLVEIARRALAATRAAAAGAGSALALDAPAPVHGTWDTARIEQLVTNLVKNAINFGAGRPIEVRVTADDGTARVVVRDHGPGVAKEDLDRIFERFERASPGPPAGGLGLGLFIARGIAEAHGGAVHASSEPGRGATFVVELPLGEPPSAGASS
ncbi:MAG: GAF domain-containing protein [Sandaracinaceae bacterium]|nr:GAF domain-containing protein [Sandaracinaceae bacterium]